MSTMSTAKKSSSEPAISTERSRTPDGSSALGTITNPHTTPLPPEKTPPNLLLDSNPATTPATINKSSSSHYHHNMLTPEQQTLNLHDVFRSVTGCCITLGITGAVLLLVFRVYLGSGTLPPSVARALEQRISALTAGPTEGITASFTHQFDQTLVPDTRIMLSIIMHDYPWFRLELTSELGENISVANVSFGYIADYKTGTTFYVVCSHNGPMKDMRHFCSDATPRNQYGVKEQLFDQFEKKGVYHVLLCLDNKNGTNIITPYINGIEQPPFEEWKSMPFSTVKEMHLSGTSGIDWKINGVFIPTSNTSKSNLKP